MSATDNLLEEVFKKFGTIKSDGIQVRSNRQQGFCFGFVEFEEASAVQKALEEITGEDFNLGGVLDLEMREHEAVVIMEVAGVTTGVISMAGVSLAIRVANRGGPSSRDGYQRSENINSNGGRVNRTGGMANGSAKSMTPRVSATA
ncbi:UNVERIFIED_CONTAM: Nuclear transport factor 2 [Sesamum radiatum]|uniref:Nuclear transport factor 2 n=1 Tax=Sesamum radiatum TaxID=300843 RepID=A0AAW2W3H3_SESRA